MGEELYLVGGHSGKHIDRGGGQPLILRYIMKKTLIFTLLFSLIILSLNSPASITNGVSNAARAIVTITYEVKQVDTFGENYSDANRTGGVIISPTKVLTVAHLFDGVPANGVITISFSDNKTKITDVKIIKFDRKLDLVLLSIPSIPEETQPIEIASQAPELGDDIFVIGFPSISLPVLRFIKYVEAPKGIFIFPAYYGDSGGGIFNSKGQLIGIMQSLMIVTTAETKQTTYFGYGTTLDKIKEFLK